MRFKMGLVAAALGTSFGCSAEGMSGAEALEALGQANRSGSGDQATQEVVEVSTEFTIGGALADAARTVADFWVSQAPCADVTLEGAVMTVDYGDLGDSCVFRGRTYAGVNTVEVRSTTPGELEVLHGWDGFTDGRVAVDGGATVTWSGDDATRRVQTAHTWSEGGESVDVTGDHVTGPLADEGWFGGFTLDGSREWTADGDAFWTLDMIDLELRYLDPAPQAGSLVVTSPAGKSLDVTYRRIDDDTIEAVLSGLRRGDAVFHISRLGTLEEVE